MTLELYSKVVLWDEACPNPVLVVLARDPDGPTDDLYPATNAVQAGPAQMVSLDADRWAIEMCFRDVKPLVGRRDPQC